jgi:hypothetical protein
MRSVHGVSINTRLTVPSIWGLQTFVDREAAVQIGTLKRTTLLPTLHMISIPSVKLLETEQRT